jgi:YesN/AraC family two-component response regulator
MSKILLVEDERILAMALRQELVRLGFEVVGTASNGRDAVSKAQEHSLDLIIMDISIDGDMNGIETALAIANVSDVQVVYLTGEADIETKTKALATPNARGYLTKPLNTKELLRLLDSIAVRPAMTGEKNR